MRSDDGQDPVLRTPRSLCLIKESEKDLQRKGQSKHYFSRFKNEKTRLGEARQPSG